MIDEYVIVLEEVIIKINDDKKYKVLQYIEWAKKKYDWLNSLKQMKDEIIDDNYE